MDDHRDLSCLRPGAPAWPGSSAAGQPALSRRAFLRLAGLSALLAACGSAGAAVDGQPANPPSPSPLPIRAAGTSTATATATIAPTETPRPSPTDTPEPTSTPSPSPTATRGPLRVISLLHGPYRALAVDNVLQRFGALSTIVRVDLGETVPNLRSYDAVIFGSGEYRPEQFELPIFQAERVRVLEALDANVPILGICLGHQLLAYWQGGEVKRGQWEIGWLPITANEAGQADPLLAGLGKTFYGFLWHGDHVTRLPEGAVLLATSEACRTQSFRLAGRPVWGVQFNPQYDPVIAEGVIRADSSLPKQGYDVDELVATGYREYHDLAGILFGNFLNQALATARSG